MSTISTLKTCEVCLQSIFPAKYFPERSPTTTCHHRPRVCRSCLSLSISSDVEEGIDPRCPATGCDAKLSHHEVQLWSKRDTLEAYDRRGLLENISETPDFRWCLAASCGSGQIHPCGDEVPIIVCTVCSGMSCYRHSVPWHHGMTCQEYDTEMKEKQKGDLETLAVLQEISKPCPRCGARIEKTGGCDHMTCQRCKFEFCWQCFVDQKVILAEGNHYHEVTCEWWRRWIGEPPRTTIVPTINQVGNTTPRTVPTVPRREPTPLGRPTNTATARTTRSGTGRAGTMPPLVHSAHTVLNRDPASEPRAAPADIIPPRALPAVLGPAAPTAVPIVTPARTVLASDLPNILSPTTPTATLVREVVPTILPTGLSPTAPKTTSVRATLPRVHPVVLSPVTSTGTPAPVGVRAGTTLRRGLPNISSPATPTVSSGLSPTAPKTTSVHATLPRVQPAVLSLASLTVAPVPEILPAFLPAGLSPTAPKTASVHATLPKVQPVVLSPVTSVGTPAPVGVRAGTTLPRDLPNISSPVTPPVTPAREILPKDPLAVLSLIASADTLVPTIVPGGLPTVPILAIPTVAPISRETLSVVLHPIGPAVPTFNRPAFAGVDKRISRTENTLMPNIPNTIPTDSAHILEDAYYMIYLGLWSAKSPADHDRVKDFATAMLKLGLLDRPVVFNGEQYGDNCDDSGINGQFPQEVVQNVPTQARQNFGFQFVRRLLRGLFLITILYIIGEYWS